MPREPPSAHRLQPCSFDGIVVDGIGAEAPVPEIGGTGEYLLVFRNTVGHADETERNSPMARYEELMEYSLYAGDFTTLPLDDGRVQFVEETPANFEKSLLVRLETPVDSEVPSRYGLLDGVDIAQPPHRDGPIAVTVDLVYLAPLSEYRSKTELRADLEAPGF